MNKKLLIFLKTSVVTKCHTFYEVNKTKREITEKL